MWAAKAVAAAAPAAATPPATAAPAAGTKTTAKRKGKGDPEVEPVEDDKPRGGREIAETVEKDYYWLKPEDRKVTEKWIELRRVGGVVQNMLIVGPSGSGKTQGQQVVAEANGMPFYKVDCASITTPDKWVGHKEVNEKGTYYVLSEHLRWLSADGFEPGMVCYDELTRLHPSMLNILIPILDGSESIWVPDLGIYVRVHPDTMICATANIGSQFSGTYGLDVALHDRFAVIQERAWPPAAEEAKILMKKTGVTSSQAQMLVDIAVQVRAKADQQAVSKPLSTRALIDCAYWVRMGMTIIEASETTWVKKYSEEGKGSSERAMVRLILQGKAGK
jgi:MoxR-like ATPase